MRATLAFNRLILYFKIKAPCSPLFFKEYLNIQARIQNVVDKRSVDYYPIQKQLSGGVL